MPFRHFFLYLSVIVLLLSGCATAPEKEPIAPPPVPQNPAILQAEIDLEKARSLEAEWNVRLNPGDAKTISLGQILSLAKQAQENGEIDRATKLAQQVIQFARLGTNQAVQQRNANPYYPQ